MAKKINPLLAIVGGLLAVLLLFAIISIVFYPGPAVAVDDPHAHGGGHGVEDDHSADYVDHGAEGDHGAEEDGAGEANDDHSTADNDETSSDNDTSGSNTSTDNTSTDNTTANENNTSAVVPPSNPDLIITFSRVQIEGIFGSVPEVGNEITLSVGSQTSKGIVREVTSNTVVIDFN